MRHLLLLCVLAVSLALSGCAAAAPENAAPQEHGQGDLAEGTTASLRTDDRERTRGGPAVDPLWADAPDSLALRLRVALPAPAVDPAPALAQGQVLAVAVVCGGFLQDPAELPLADAVALGARDFAYHRELAPVDLCLAARIGRADRLLLCALDADRRRWRAWLFDVASGRALGGASGTCLDPAGAAPLLGAWSDLALLLGVRPAVDTGGRAP